MVMNRRFGRRNWLFTADWNVDGTQQAFYVMSDATAVRWSEASEQLDAEQSDAAVDAETESDADSGADPSDLAVDRLHGNPSE
jgi:hypothetical protein